MKEEQKYTLSFIAVMLLSSVLIIAGNGVGGGIGKYVIVEAAMPIAAAVAAILTKRRPAETFMLTLPRIRDFFAGLLVFAGALCCQSAVISLLSMLSEKFAMADSGVYVSYINNASPVSVIFVFAFMPAVCEELLYRGFAMTTVGKVIGNRKAALIFTSVLFALMHFNVYKFIPVLICGFALGYIALNSGSVLITILLHFINNSMAVISYYLDKDILSEAEVEQVYGNRQIAVASLILIGVSVLLFLLGRLIFKSAR